MHVVDPQLHVRGFLAQILLLLLAHLQLLLE